ncbi:MAG: InlB B-repeat-containing protein [Bacilli bacterium]|nr:InlB B-repeat-containing protein [Bacilli bacterium]
MKKFKIILFIIFGLFLTSCTLSGGVEEHEHTPKEEYKYDDTYHYHECTFVGCKEKIEKEEHNFDDGLLKEVDSKKYILYTCVDCGKTKREEYNVSDHVHNFSNKYSYNEKQHFHACTFESCKVVKDEADHIFNHGVVITPATEEKEGVAIFACISCGYSYEGSIPKLEHTHKPSNELSADEVNHYNECPCGEQFNKEKHQFNSGVVEKEPTEEETGIKIYTCLICGYDKEEVLPKLEHTHAGIGDYLSNETSHYKKCSCGIDVDKGSHIFDLGTVIKPATTTSTGIKEYSCKVCEYKKTETLPIISTFNIEYDLGFTYYETKKDLYNAFFTDFYNFMKENTDCDFESLGLNSVDDFLTYCMTWKADGMNEMQHIGARFGKYFLTVEVGGSFETQPTTTFVGYCYQNDMYVDLLEFLEVFFAYWRTDEGYTTSTNNGNDFFASAWAAIIDTCKYFYFTSSSITDTYAWFTKERSPRVHYALDHTPYVMDIDLVTTSSETLTLSKIDRMYYDFLGWFDEDGNVHTDVSEDIKLYAKFERRTHQVVFNTGGHIQEFTIKEGNRTKLPNYELTNAYIKGYVDEHFEEYDIYNAVMKDLELYVLWESNTKEIGSIKISGYNTQEATSTIAKYEGIRLFKSGVALDSSVYWYKVLLEYSNGNYVIKSIIESGSSINDSYDYLIMVFSGESTGGIDSIKALGLNVGNIVSFSTDITSLSKGEVNIDATFIGGADSYNIILKDFGADNFTYKQLVEGGSTYTLPIPTKEGYTFVGWYDNSEFLGSRYTSLSVCDNVTFYAKWKSKTANNALDYISDIVTSYTKDTIPSVFGGFDVTYTSSDPNLYTIENGFGYTNRQYQTHQKQVVTVTVTYSDGTSESKNIQIDPVLYDEMDHPKSVYFAVGSAGSYKKYNERYLSDGTLFSDKFKENMDMVYYAFAVPQSDGTLTINTTYIEEVMKLKNHGIRVTVVIDGANAAPLKAMVKLCDNETTRAKFVRNILDIVTTYNFDGVDVDWEFPGILSSQSGYEKYTTAVDIANLNSLLKELRAGFNELQDEGGTNYLLTVATPPTDWGVDRYDYKTINTYCDYVNMMSYDLNKSSNTSHLTHVYQPSNSYSYKFCCDFGVSYYTGLGLDKSKIILGCAGYGKAYKVTGQSPNASLPGLGATATLGQVTGYGLPGQAITWNSGTIYYTGIQTLINSGKFKQYNEYNSSGKLVGSYLYSSSDNYFITFDSVLSVTEKCKYAQANKGMGIMVWAYGEDATDTIVNTICDNLK